MYAQEGLPVYLDYLSDNYYLVHPSMAGAFSGTEVRLTARQQWFGIEDAPSLQTLSVNTRLGERSGLGAVILNDKNGYHAQTGLKLTYAHHISLDQRSRFLNQLSFGISGVFLQGSLDESEFFDYNGVPDPNIYGSDQTASYMNIDLGVSYMVGDFYIHGAVMNLTKVRRGVYSDVEPGNRRRILFSTGYTFGNGEWTFEPSTLFQYVQYTKESTIDINAKAYRSIDDFGNVWGGLSYRTSLDGAEYILGQSVNEQKLQLLSPIVGFNYNNFLFAYTYSYQFGDIKFQNGGYHQITLGFDIGKEEEPYHCNCPFAK